MTTPTLWLDTETYSALDLERVGTYHYAEHAEAMLITYAVDDGPVQCWDYSDGTPPPDIPAWVQQYDATVIAHRAVFDRNVLRLGNLHWDIPIERWRCTMTQAYCHALPGSLDMLGQVLGLPADQRKLKEGRRLMLMFSKPAPKGRKVARYTRDTHPEEWSQFIEYAKQDVTAMREIGKRLPRWNWQPDDVAMWHLDQRINDRGFAVDLDLVRAGARAATEEKASITARFRELTGGLSPTQRDRVREYINSTYGMQLTSTAKATIAPLVDDESQPETLREICQLILTANKTSTAKYAALADALSDDGRFRGGLLFAGASRTRRWSGQVFQPQNLPSRGLPKNDMIEAYIAALKAGCHRDMFDDLMLYGSAALRGVVVA